MADLAVELAFALIEKVSDSLHQEINRNKNVVQDLEDIKGDLRLMKAYLRDAEGEAGGEVRKLLLEKIQDSCHKMEDVMDKFMMHAPRHFSDNTFIQSIYEFAHDVKHHRAIVSLQSQIAHIKKNMQEIKSSPLFAKLHISAPSDDGSRRKPRGPEEIVEEDDAFGIDLPKQNLINMVISKSSTGDTRRKTISVVGPGGSGKTVLVNAVYKSNIVIGQFDCHAWLSLSSTYNPEQLLQNLVSQICDGMNFPSGGDPATTLRNYLIGRRYLVVLDYVWRDQDLTDIRSKLPDHRNGSTIIITTRYEEVAAECSSSNDYIFRVDGLDRKLSWKLFCKKAFGSDSGECPPHLQDWADGIVTRCEGSPEAISAVGRLLSRKEEEPVEWKRVCDNLGAQIGANILLPSYDDLPSNLKLCLLYFSILPEDRSIKRERLVRLWLSEGLVNSLDEPPERKAEDSLNELISRNLVTASSRDFRGRVRSCRVQNLMRELILQKSKEEKFIEVVTSSDMHPRAEEIRRLSIQCASSSGLTSLQLDTVRRVRSLFMFGLDISLSLRVPEILQRVRLLKVLDLEDAPLDTFPDCILDVALLLKYLSLRNTKVSIVPKNIKRLRYLEYLDLKETQVTALPGEICSLQYLKHLLVYRHNPTKHELFHRLQGVEIVGELRVLHSIKKLSIMKVSTSPSFFKVLEQLTQLKKLGLVDLKQEDGQSLCACIEKIPNLSTLDLTSTSKEEYLDLDHMEVYPAFIQHLYLKGRIRALPKWIASLSSLVRLNLRCSKLSNSPIELLQHMPILMELEMDDAFTGEVLLFDGRGFPKLRTLRIEQFDGLDTIEVFGGAMPMLQKLTIVRCKRLLDLPFGIEGLRCLAELLLYDMPQDFTRRLGKISEDRQKINHVPCIRSFTVNASGGWDTQNFS